METTKTLKSFLLVWVFAAGLAAASSSFQDEKNYYPPYKNASPPPPVTYQYPPPAQPNNPPSGGGITPPVPSHGHHHHHHHHHEQKPPTANCGTPPSAPPATPTKPPAVVTPPSPTVTPPTPATPTKPPVVTPPTPTGDHNPSPPKGGCTCGTPPSSTPPAAVPVVVAPSPATQPPSAAPSPTPYASPPSTTKTTTPLPPKTPSATPDVITNSPPPPLFPEIPFLGGTCFFWRLKLQILSDIFGWWSTIIGKLLGIGGIPRLGSSMDFQEALWNTGTDGIGALYREGAAALLNSMVNINFPFTTSHVRESFVAALASEKVAAAQAEVFRLANEGYLKPRI